jgi:hypothetical protein
MKKFARTTNGRGEMPLGNKFGLSSVTFIMIFLTYRKAFTVTAIVTGLQDAQETFPIFFKFSYNAYCFN